MMNGPWLPILLLAIPVLFAAIVFMAGLVSWLRPSSPIPRAIVVSQTSRDAG